MKKLTLVSLLCRGKVVREFIMLPVYYGKSVIHPGAIDKLFLKHHGFIPERGETISIGI